jgi:hypothetical protein
MAPTEPATEAGGRDLGDQDRADRPLAVESEAWMIAASRASLSRDGVRWRLQFRVPVKALLDRLDRFRAGRETGEAVE